MTLASHKPNPQRASVEVGVLPSSESCARLLIVGFIIRRSTESDLPFLDAHDEHLPTQVLADLISRGNILIGEVAGRPAGWLRWGLFWDEIFYQHAVCAG